MNADKPCREAIELLAYILWELRGHNDGESDADWLQAEAELTRALQRGVLQGFGPDFVNDRATAAQLRAFAATHCR